MNESDGVRAFVALAVPDEAARELARVQRAIEEAAPGFVRWTPSDRLHLTLYFLGTLDPTALASVRAALARLTPPRLPLALGSLTYFPEATNPRVIAAAFAGETNGLRRFQLQVHDAVFQLAEHKETRAYSPHVTLGRLRPDKPVRAKVFKAALAKAPSPRATAFTVAGFRLVASETGPGGATYRDLEVFSAP